MPLKAAGITENATIVIEVSAGLYGVNQ